jgi:hypothetical protein
MNEISLWLSLLFSNWSNAVCGGGVGVGIVAILIVTQLVWGWTMPKIWYILIFIVFFILGASFIAWRDEHRKSMDLFDQLAKEKDHSRPKLNGQIGGLLLSPVGQQKENSVILVSLMITNIGAPSIVHDIHLAVQAGDIPIEGEFIPPSKEGISFSSPNGEEGQAIVFPLEDDLTTKGVDKPISTGGGLRGFLFALVRNLPREQFASAGLIVVSFRDILGEKYVTEYQVAEHDDKNILSHPEEFR